jgi:hypothetical protein
MLSSLGLGLSRDRVYLSGSPDRKLFFQSLNEKVKDVGSIVEA